MFEIENRTRWCVQPLFVADEKGCPVLAVLVKATLQIGTDGEVDAAEEQLPVCMESEYWGDPATSSLRYEGEFAFIKPGADVILIGHAVAPRPSTTELLVGLQVGDCSKVAIAIGDRTLYHGLSGERISSPVPFERIPLRYELAFGGTDPHVGEGGQVQIERRNPVGRGYRHKGMSGRDDVLLPNLEDPKHRFATLGDAPPPAGFGFIATHWLPRAQWSGTFDATWNSSRKPWLPSDFDRRYFNAATPGLVLPGPLRGDEAVTVVNTTPSGRVDFRLPGWQSPDCQVLLRRGVPLVPAMALDTMVIDTDALTVQLTWRGHCALPRGAHDVLHIEIRHAGAPARVPRAFVNG